jgi:hypothetical protein
MPTLKPSIYLRKRGTDHPFWEFARLRNEVPFSLRQLADADRVPTNREWTLLMFSYLRNYFDDEDMPIEVVDYDGQPVSPLSLAA